MKFKELLDAPVKELELKLRQNRAEQMELRKKRSAGSLEKPHMVRLLKKDAARLLTALSQKKANERKEPSVAPVKQEEKEKISKTKPKKNSAK